MRFYLIFTICTSLFVFTACTRPQTPTTNNSPTATSQAEENLKSTTEKASNTVQSALDKAHSAVDQATQKAQSTINQAQSAAEQATQSASKAVKEVVAFKEALQGMATGVSNTVNAVNSGDFTTAQQEFSQLQGNWTKISNTVNTKSATVHQEIDSQIKAIATLLKEPNPDQAKLVTELKALGKNVTNFLSQQ